MPRKYNYPQSLLQQRPDIMERLIDGEPYASIAYSMKIAKDKIVSMMRMYKPMQSWISVRRKNTLLLEDEMLQYLAVGKGVDFLSELYDMPSDEIKTFLERLGRRDGKEYVRKPGNRRLITVHDVARFKVSIKVGESLVCDETEEGTVRYCTITGKHLWYADTDMGTYEWNWLAVKNENRVFEDEKYR